MARGHSKHVALGSVAGMWCCPQRGVGRQAAARGGVGMGSCFGRTCNWGITDLSCSLNWTSVVLAWKKLELLQKTRWFCRGKHVKSLAEFHDSQPALGCLAPKAPTNNQHGIFGNTAT
ncbi:hypothetical protein GGX14DRAFT_394096 [Mycena pura]|uniref:Uncharacterized protein n=1 Tax=Mycena pura TaxID=153505 RepID=A0AAD6VGW9_9AGAR|nr:hypothetical protein GGX14DRAFT_394096 [Mycena pura]